MVFEPFKFNAQGATAIQKNKIPNYLRGCSVSPEVSIQYFCGKQSKRKYCIGMPRACFFIYPLFRIAFGKLENLKIKIGFLKQRKSDALLYEIEF